MLWDPNFPPSVPSVSEPWSSSIDQAGYNGGPFCSPDRAHDHYWGQRCKPTGLAGAILNVIDISGEDMGWNEWNSGSLVLVCRSTWLPSPMHPWWAQKKTQPPPQTMIPMTTQISSTPLALMRSLLTLLLQVTPAEIHSFAISVCVCDCIWTPGGASGLASQFSQIHSFLKCSSHSASQFVHFQRKTIHSYHEAESNPNIHTLLVLFTVIAANCNISSFLLLSGPVGMAAAAAVATGKKRKRPHIFESNPSIRKRQQTRLLRWEHQESRHYSPATNQASIAAVPFLNYGSF